jgi:hypothetical protein
MSLTSLVTRVCVPVTGGLCDAVAGTNYIMWYPFRASSSALPVPSDPDLLFRYTLSFK